MSSRRAAPVHHRVEATLRHFRVEPEPAPPRRAVSLLGMGRMVPCRGWGMC